MASHFPVVYIMGPTASGKTDLAVALARQYPAEVISVDSAQVYRGMDVGTAKPSAALRAEIPHHLIDILDPREAYSAARFRDDALALIAAIRDRGRLPLLVGGTMLYFRALRYGLAPMPSADRNVRDRLEAEARTHGWAALHERLADLDPTTAARLHPNDQQRIERALEVVELTGQPLSSLTAQSEGEPPPGPSLRLALAPASRAVLHHRIEERFRAMLAAGFVDEVRTLRSRGDLDLDCPSMRAVGYRQVWRYLDGELDEQGLVERGVVATRQFAKRQLTWLRRESDARWFDPGTEGMTQRIIDQLKPMLG
jgi:tRNA dimethylallyltransferase